MEENFPTKSQEGNKMIVSNDGHGEKEDGLHCKASQVSFDMKIEKW